MADEKSNSILLVDDESNITSALKRLLRKDHYNIFIASSGKEGLKILADNKIDLIVSDMKMPEMDGAVFLEKSKKLDNSIIRILLTGYSDMNSTISAINKSEIFQYIAKPWNEEDLRLTIKRGLELKFLEKSRIRLEKLTARQNKELAILNKDLESKVEFRTKKLREMMEELGESNETIKNNYLYIIKTFSSLTDMRGGHLDGHSRRVAENARKLSKLLHLNDEDTQDIFFGSLLHDIGKIGLSDEILSKPECLLSPSEMERKKKHSVWGEGLLLGMDKFQAVAGTIRHHHEQYNGKGYPDQLKADQIPIGARILAVVNDFDSLQSGALFQKKYSVEEAVNFLNSNRKIRYDPAVVTKFVSQFKKEKVKENDRSKFRGKKCFYTYQLKPGMILSHDLLTKDRMLLLTKGHELDENIIKRLIHHEQTLKEIFDVKVCINLLKNHP